MKLNVAPCSFLLELVAERKIWLISLWLVRQETCRIAFQAALSFCPKHRLWALQQVDAQIETQRLQEM